MELALAVVHSAWKRHQITTLRDENVLCLWPGSLAESGKHAVFLLVAAKK